MAEYITFQPSDHFNTKLYTGNGSTNAITGVGFQPDWVWIKDRESTEHHNLFDVVRGATKRIYTSSQAMEDTAATTLTSFDSDGFSLGSSGAVNASGNNTVSWNWRAAGGQGSSNTDGSINTTYTSANTTSGFSISTYTGTGSNATVGHGLGVAPEVVWIKKRSGGGNEGMYGYYKSIGAGNIMSISETGAAAAGASLFQSTDPTSSVFSIGTHASVNNSGSEYVAYSFAPIKGFSKFGSYVGNASASDNAFVYCGFKPAFLITKCSSISGDRWTLYDNKRDPYNYVYRRLFPDGNIAESLNTDADIDFLSNGFKIRTDAGTSGAAQTYIYMAFAEHPLVSSNDIPGTAR